MNFVVLGRKGGKKKADVFGGGVLASPPPQVLCVTCCEERQEKTNYDIPPLASLLPRSKRTLKEGFCTKPGCRGNVSEDLSSA